MALRREGLRKYRANEFSTIAGPPARAYFPHIGNGSRSRAGFISDFPPIWTFAQRFIETSAQNHSIRILEIGPGPGVLATHLQQVCGDRIAAYFGVERDESYSGPYQRIRNVNQVDKPVDLVIASEVAEHMTADQWFGLLEELAPVLVSDASIIVSVPNPTSPGGIARDFTHVQNYPWYDLYAMMRLQFQNVEIHRAYYVWSVQRLVSLLPRMLICPLMEFDWCDTLICLASRPTP